MAVSAINLDAAIQASFAGSVTSLSNKDRENNQVVENQGNYLKWVCQKDLLPSSNHVQEFTLAFRELWEAKFGLNISGPVELLFVTFKSDGAQGIFANRGR
jgi:hypothetical protein